MPLGKAIFGVMLIATFGGYVGTSSAEPASLSCEMQMLLNGMAAMERDRGLSRQANTLSTNRDTDLTKKEIKTILDRVYIQKRNDTPDQIKDAVYKACQNGR